jgi:hypothetical protein
MPGTMKGRFSPRQPEKYRGNPLCIFYRSGWELQYFTLLDTSPEVVWWSSEEKSFPYLDKTCGKVRRYYPDIIMGVQREGFVEVRVVEIKPHKYTEPPPPPKSGRRTKSYMNTCLEYVRNQCKWDSMRKECENRGWNFQVLTEETNPEWKWKPKPLKPLKPIKKRKK